MTIATNAQLMAQLVRQSNWKITSSSSGGLTFTRAGASYTVGAATGQRQISSTSLSKR